MRLEFFVSACVLGIAGTVICLGIPVFAGLLLVGQPQGSESCKFSVLGELTKTAVTGPEDVVRLVRVIEQPDSPVEVVAIDFEGTWVAVHNERYSYGERCKYRIRNRSSRLVTGGEVFVIVGPHAWAGGGGPPFPSQWGNLAPGQEAELGGGGGGGSGGTGGAPSNRVIITVGVAWVDFGDCVYYPSRRIPRELDAARP